MDNANQIKQNLTHKEVALFLGDELKKYTDESTVTYNLEEEYAKTAHNKKKFVWILLALSFFIVGASTFTTIALVSNSHHKITINIDSFDDLNLRSLLNSVGRAQSLYEKSVREKDTLLQNRDNELNQAKQKHEMDLFTLQSVASVAAKASLAEKKAAIDEEYEAQVLEIHKNYDQKIQEAEEDMKKYESKVHEYDSDKLTKAKDAQATIDSTKQLHDIEMKYQQEQYENKIRTLRQQLIDQQLKAVKDQKAAVEEVRRIYQAKIDLLDPKAREQNSEQNKIILGTGIKNRTSASALWRTVDSLKFNEADFTNPSIETQFSDSLKKAKKGLSELRTLGYRFKPMPMENSIKDYVPAMLHESYQVAKTLAESGAKMQEEIQGFEKIAETVLSDRSADGLILSVKNAPEFTVYVSSLSRSKIGEEAVPVQILSGSRHAADGLLSIKNGSFVVTQAFETSEAEKTQIYTPAAGDKIKIVQPR